MRIVPRIPGSNHFEGNAEWRVAPACHPLEFRLHRRHHGRVGLDRPTFVRWRCGATGHARPVWAEGGTQRLGREEPRRHDPGTALDGQIKASKRSSRRIGLDDGDARHLVRHRRVSVSRHDGVDETGRELSGQLEDFRIVVA